MKRPLIGISVGDPAGIGPEIAAKALALPEIYEMCRPLIAAESQMMREAVRFSGLEIQVRPAAAPREGLFRCGVLDVLDLKNIDAASITHKRVSAECGRASFEYVKKVIDPALAGEVRANPESLADALRIAARFASPG